MTVGQVPFETSVWLTVRDASGVQTSAIFIPPARASRAATVVAADGAALASQPSTVVTDNEPVTTGAWVSSTLMV